MSSSIHSAQAPYLGYRFEPFYALLVLWNETEDDMDKVFIEADDDVVLTTKSTTRLYQLKHSTGRASSLNINDDDFWKTIRIWSQFATSNTHELFFVTKDNIPDDNPLIKLVKGEHERQEIVDLMIDEARRVIDARERASVANTKNLPYQKRIKGCQSFMDLTPKERLELIEKITIRPNNFNIFQVYNEILKKLESMVVSKVRPQIAIRLMEWWDIHTLNPKLSTTKADLLLQLHSLLAQFQDNNLPDDYSKQSPISIEEELGGYMEKQIDLVNGGLSRKRRAAIARWRARNQREKWMTEDILSAFELDEYDKALFEAWLDRHGPMKDDLVGDSDISCRQKGLELLDWVHSDAHLHINPIRSEWRQHFLIHGSYQQMAEELKVGWHPNYFELLSEKS